MASVTRRAASSLDVPLPWYWVGVCCASRKYESADLARKGREIMGNMTCNLFLVYHDFFLNSTMSNIKYLNYSIVNVFNDGIQQEIVM